MLKPSCVVCTHAFRLFVSNNRELRATAMRDLTVREMQAFAAICLWKYCRTLGIQHRHIDELFQHLIGILTTEHLTVWNQQGSLLEIAGRGDSLSAEVLSCVPLEHHDSFSRLVEWVVEVGIVDLFGAPTEQPAYFVSMCTKILQDTHVEVPRIDPLLGLPASNLPWGDAITAHEAAQLLRAYGISL